VGYRVHRPLLETELGALVSGVKTVRRIFLMQGMRLAFLFLEEVCCVEAWGYGDWNRKLNVRQDEDLDRERDCPRMR
jgi:uncharacterized protein with beta-barrel porin domain